jgi:hypothetical protein
MPADELRGDIMKALWLAAAATTLAVTVNGTGALADGPRASSSHVIAQTNEAGVQPGPANAHYEWQYHYTGHHPHFEGHWVLVKN